MQRAFVASERRGFVVRTKASLAGFAAYFEIMGTFCFAPQCLRLKGDHHWLMSMRKRGARSATCVSQWQFGRSFWPKFDGSNR